MRNIKLFSYITFLLLIFSCSNSNDDLNSNNGGLGAFNFNAVNITTTGVFNTSSLTISTGGNASTNIPNNYNYGVCYSTSPNPTVNNSIVNAYDNSNGNFTNTIKVEDLGKTYYIRAFIKEGSTNIVKYGNEVSVSIPADIITGIAKNISLDSFTVECNVGSLLTTNSERGICLSTSPNPTISNNIQVNPTAGLGSYIMNVDLNQMMTSTYNKTFYVRSYVKFNGSVYYGNEITFKSAGYIGGSGGYIFYDKGEVTNGWRYLEAPATKLNDPGSNNFQWSTVTGFLSNIQTEIGTGKENSLIIKAANNYTNIAAAMAIYNSVNNVNDWFLPSLNELKELYKLKKVGLIFSPSSGSNSYYNKTVLSSSQYSQDSCYGIDFETGAQVVLSKTLRVYSGWQIRRL
ncbi:hypothetical protein [Chryseobacterium sp. sg2396]|nr:hypothetical protein [uncultured Chryseobacterium sp.]